MVWQQLPKLWTAGSIPVSRSNKNLVSSTKKSMAHLEPFIFYKNFPIKF